MTEVQESIAVDLFEAGRRVSLNERSIREAIKRGDLPAKKFGRRTLVSVDALSKWFAALDDA